MCCKCHELCSLQRFMNCGFSTWGSSIHCGLEENRREEELDSRLNPLNQLWARLQNSQKQIKSWSALSSPPCFSNLFAVKFLIGSEKLSIQLVTFLHAQVRILNHKTWPSFSVKEKGPKAIFVVAHWSALYEPRHGQLINIGIPYCCHNFQTMNSQHSVIDFCVSLLSLCRLGRWFDLCVVSLEGLIL